MHIFKKSLAIVLLAALWPSGLWAENGVDLRRTKEISSNPLQLLGGALPISFRFALSDKAALGVHAIANFFDFQDRTDHFGIGLGLSGKFFLSNLAFEDSWFIEPGVAVGYLFHQTTDTKVKNNYVALTGSVIGGYGWVWDSGFSLNLGLGVRYTHAFVNKKIFGSEYSWGLHGFFPAGDFSLGYAW